MVRPQSCFKCIVVWEMQPGLIVEGHFLLYMSYSLNYLMAVI